MRDWLLRRISPPRWVIAWVVRQGDLRNQNFSDRDLSGCRFARATMNECHFEAAHIKHSSFYGADLEGANLKMANLSSAEGSIVNLMTAKPWTNPNKERIPGYVNQGRPISVYGLNAEKLSQKYPDSEPA